MLNWIKGKTSANNRRDISKYNFHIKHEPQIIDSSTTLTLTTYTSEDEMAAIPCRFRWSIIKNGLTIEVPEFKGSSFRCEPSDVGSILQAQVISTDPQFDGTAVIHFGPVKLDFNLKKQIELALTSGCATMSVSLVNPNHNPNSSDHNDDKQCQLKLFQDVIKINHAYPEINYTFDYSIYEPRVECISKDSCKIVIIFNQKYESQLKRFMDRLFVDGGNSNGQPMQYGSNNLYVMGGGKSSSSSTNANSNHLNRPSSNKLQLRFSNRTSRDIFLFTMKAYNTKKQLRSSVIMRKVEQINYNDQQTFDYLLQIESLKGELVKMDSMLRRTQQEKLHHMSSAKKLQKEIEQIIVTYTRIVQEKFLGSQNHQLQLQEISKDYSLLSNKRDEVMNRKYGALQKQNAGLNQRIQALAKQIDEIRFKPPGVAKSQSGSPQPQQLYYNGGTTGMQQPQPQLPSPFMKKRQSLQSQQAGDNTKFANLLDELGESRISYVSSNYQTVQTNGQKQQSQPNNVHALSEQLKQKYQKAQSQKNQLQKKLEMSFIKIDKLQKDLFEKQQQIKMQKQQQQQQGGQLQSGQLSQRALTTSSVNFYYQGNGSLVHNNNNSSNHGSNNNGGSSSSRVSSSSNNNNLSPRPNSQNSVYDVTKQQALKENHTLKKANQQLSHEKRELIDKLKEFGVQKKRLTDILGQKAKELKEMKELKEQKEHELSQSQSQLKKGVMGQSEGDEQIKNSLNFLKTHKKKQFDVGQAIGIDGGNIPSNDHINSSRYDNHQVQKQLYEIIDKKDSRIKLLTLENEALKQANTQLKKQLSAAQSKSGVNSNVNGLSTTTSTNQTKLQKRIKQLQEQIQMYKKNSDALNRSQQISQCMDDYNEEQITMLKQHNDFLTTENEKLAKGCERYMTEAKEANKLRMDILKLKERINELQALDMSGMMGGAVGVK